MARLHQFELNPCVHLAHIALYQMSAWNWSNAVYSSWIRASSNKGLVDTGVSMWHGSWVWGSTCGCEAPAVLPPPEPQQRHVWPAAAQLDHIFGQQSVPSHDVTTLFSTHCYTCALTQSVLFCRRNTQDVIP